MAVDDGFDGDVGHADPIAQVAAKTDPAPSAVLAAGGNEGELRTILGNGRSDQRVADADFEVHRRVTGSKQ